MKASKTPGAPLKLWKRKMFQKEQSSKRPGAKQKFQNINESIPEGMKRL
jgi:hypothetical protein